MSEGANLHLEERDGAIILTLADHYAILPPEQAKEIAETMAKYAYHAQYGQDPKTNSIIAEQIREKMITRISHVVRSLQEKKKPPLYIAHHVVDIVMGEVL